MPAVLLFGFAFCYIIFDKLIDQAVKAQPLFLSVNSVFFFLAFRKCCCKSVIFFSHILILSDDLLLLIHTFHPQVYYTSIGCITQYAVCTKILRNICICLSLKSIDVLRNICYNNINEERKGAVKLDKKIKKLVKLVQQLNKLMIEIIGLIGYILIIKDLLK